MACIHQQNAVDMVEKLVEFGVGCDVSLGSGGYGFGEENGEPEATATAAPEATATAAPEATLPPSKP